MQGASAATCTSVATGNWGTASTWNCTPGAPSQRVPVSTDDAVIANGVTVTLNANSSITNFTINAGSTLADGARNLTVSGNVVINGTWSGSNGTLIMSGPATSTVDGAGTITNIVRLDITIANKTILSTANLNFTGTGGEIRIANGLTVTNNGIVSPITVTGRNGASTWINGANSTLNVKGGGTALMATGILTASAVGNAVNYIGPAQTVKLPSGNTYYHLAFSGSGAKTLPGTAMTIGGNFTSLGTITSTAGAALTVNGNIDIGTGTTFSASTFSHSVKGNWTRAGTFNANTSTFTFNGTSPQSLTGATTFNNFIMNNANGLSLNNDVTVNATCTFTNGNITTGTNTFIVNSGAGTITRTSGHVIGNLRKNFPTLGAGQTRTFELGTATTYTPAIITGTVTTTGNLTVAATTSQHPNAATSGIDDAKNVNVYWSLTPSTLAFSTYSLTVRYNTTDIDIAIPALNPVAEFVAERYLIGWFTTGSTTSNPSAGVYDTLITGLSAFGDFSVGKLRNNVDHFYINSSISGSTCQPSSITISAHRINHTVLATYIGTISLSTNTGNGDWSINTGNGILATGAADSGTANYTFASSDNGVVILNLRDTHAQNINIDITDGIATERSGTASGDAPFDTDITFLTTTFSFLANNVANAIGTQTAGANFNQTIELQAAGCAGAGAELSGTKNIELAFECNDPVACAGQQVSINGTPISANNSGAVLTYTSVPLNFTTGKAPLTTPNYPDVGKIMLHAKYTLSPSNEIVMGSSNQFVVKPAGFVLSNIQRTADNFANPGATNANGAIFIKAGEDFTATVTAVNSNNVATPNYGKEASPEGAKLTSTLVGGLGLTANPAITNLTTFGSFTNGVATGTTFSWGEVGITTLTPSVGDGNYLGVGDVTGTVSGNVGRFTPFDFNVTGNTPSFNPGCAGSTFSYIGQPFSYAVAPAETITARNKAGGTTLNYTKPAGPLGCASCWWKLANLGMTAPNNGVPIHNGALPGTVTLNTSLATNSGVICTNCNGQIAVTFGGQLSYDKGNGAPVGPFSPIIDIRSSIIDSDNIAFASNPFAFSIAGSEQRFGRLKIDDAIGPENLDLLMPISVEYWADTGGGVFDFITSATDSCTSLTRTPMTATPTTETYGDIYLSNYTNNLTLGATDPTPTPNPILFTSGQATLTMQGPGNGNDGSVLITLLSINPPGQTNQPWLQYDWSGAGTGHNQNSSATATFGIFQREEQFIYTREQY